MAATNFCQVYDCSTTGFFRIDRFSDILIPYSFKFQDGFTIDEMNYMVDDGWNGAATNHSVTAGHGIALDTNDDGIVDTQIYSLAQTNNMLPLVEVEFCHPGLGCTGFGNGTGIILPPRENNDPVYINIPIPSQIAEDGAPIYSEDQDEFFGGGFDEGGEQECFVAGTKVKMSNGLEKNIEDIKIGEQVLSYNIHTKKIESKKVTELYTQVHDLVDGDITVKTKFNNGVETHNTIANPFWSKDKGFVAADAERCNTLHSWVKQTNKGKDTEQLKVGDTLYHYNGKELQEVMVTEIEHIVEPYIRTYDIKVQGNHTFFANGILTHNSGGGGIYGCMDSSACNYNPLATIEFSPSNCTYPSLCPDGVTEACPGECPEQQLTPRYQCCLPGTHQATVYAPGYDFVYEDGEPETVAGIDQGFNQFNVGNVYNDHACNQMDCSSPASGEINVHFDGYCVGAMGQYGLHGHNIVLQHYYSKAFDFVDGGGGINTDVIQFHYPYFENRNPGVFLSDIVEYRNDFLHPSDIDEMESRYYEPMFYDGSDETYFNEWADGIFPGTDAYDIGIFNPVFDRWQVGVDSEGNTLYDLPIYRNLTCDDIQPSDTYTGTLADYDLAIGLTKSPFLSQDVNSLYLLKDSVVQGIDYCGRDELIDDAFDKLFTNPLYFNLIVNLFAQYSTDVWLEPVVENYQIPSSANGFELGESGINIDAIFGNDIDYIENDFKDDVNLHRDVLIRAGFPLPPISFNQEGCDGVRESYLQLVDEFIGSIEQLTFFTDFEIPNVKIEPTMKNQLDVLSGIDLREEGLNACSHMEFMTLPAGAAQGDGIYYKGSDLPNEYFEYTENADAEEYIKNFACDTEWDRNLRFSRLRATCKDGSTVMVGNAGDNANQGIGVNETDKIFNNGIEACNSLLKLNSSQDLYYLADNDGKESLGIFFFDSENQSSENFINDKDESFEQYVLENMIQNNKGREIDFIYTDQNYDDRNWGDLYEAEGWKLCTSAVESPHLFQMDEPYRSAYQAPYWRANYSECFSYNKCIVFDTLKPIQNDSMNGYDPRQAITTFVNPSVITASPNLKRKKQKFKLSFMMKTIELNDGVELKNTGISTALEFTDNDNYSSLSSTLEGFKTRPYKTSQCSKNGKNQNHFSSVLTEEEYCTKPRASFTNTKMNEWEKMEYVFEVDHDVNFNSYDNARILFSSLQFAKNDANFFINLNTFVGSFDDYMRENASVILVDDVEFEEAYDFHPDVDVRKKKGPNDYGLVSLMEYYDRFKPTFNIEEFNDTTAPLEVQFYFYPRFPYDDTLSPQREILLEEFQAEQFYVSDIDWGDGSPIEFTDEPQKISTTDALYHTYEQSGIYEIKGTMFVTVSETYNFSFNPEDVEYIGNVGVGHNKKFRVKISINEGPDEDFTYFGTEGFSFVPYTETIPVIGGHSKESIYYKSIKRNLGIIDSNSGVELVDVNYLRVSDRLKTESAFQKMDSSYNDSGAFDILNYYQQSIDITLDISAGYLSTLPFPRYFQEFDILNINDLTYETVTRWAEVGRPDIGSEVLFNLQSSGESIGLIGMLDDPFVQVAIGPLDDINQSITDVQLENLTFEIPYDPFLNTYACAIVFGGTTGDPEIDGSPINGNYQVTQAAGTAVDSLGREWNTFECVLNNIQAGDLNIPVLSESDTYNPSETYINPTALILTEQYTGKQYSSTLEELGNSIGDVDLSNTKYYNKPKSIWELFGFEEEDLEQIGTPNNPRYWKNIIPKDYSIFNREGLDGDLIDTYSEQEWLNGSYYPVLPRHGQDGNFIEGDFPNDNIPFPNEGVITNNKQDDESLLINFTSENIDTNVLSDESGGQNKGFILGDFKPKFDNETLEIKKTKSLELMKKSNKNRAF